jgi:hypothetical protein
MSKIKVNSIEAATGTTVTLPSGQTLDLSSGTVTLPNSSVNLTTKVTGTLPVANGGTGLTTLGSASQVLRVNSGATALEFAAVSSDYVLLATTDITSSTASVSFDGYFSSTYKNYIAYYTNVVPVTDRQTLYIRFRRSNADVTTSNYKQGGYSFNSESAGSIGAFGTVTTTFLYGLQDATNNGNNASSGSIILNDPLSTNTKHSFFLNQIDSWDNTNIHFRLQTLTGFLTDNNNALSGISFLFASGNIARGNFTLYGIK